MDIRTFAELTTPDERSLRCTPLGLATGGKLSPENAAEFQQRCIAAANLVPAVPEGVRSSFERLRVLHAYGVLFYDAFALADDLSWVVLEQACPVPDIINTATRRGIGSNGHETEELYA